MKFKTRMINAAVAAALGTVAGAAQAVNISVDGGGSALVYAYYTMQTKGMNPFDTLISIVNTDSVNGKAVKVRFLEPKNTKEVLDFNLYLSPNDVWVAAVTRDSSGNPILRTTDNTCTAPQIPVVSTVGTVVTREVAFVNFAYATDNANDGSLARAREGYVEMLQMGDIVPAGGGVGNYSGSRTLLTDITHNSVGVPANCPAVSAAWATGGMTSNAVADPTGTLMGAATIINALEGTDISYNAIALAGWRTTKIHVAPGTSSPVLDDVSPQVSAVMDGTSLVVTDWQVPILGGSAPAISPVSAIFQRDAIYNEFAWGSGSVGLGTDWVVNFLTKTYHIKQAGQTTSLYPARPFTSSLTTTGACEAIALISYNREEAASSSLSFSPGTSQSLCWEVNVLSWGSSNVLGAQVTRVTVNTPYTEGWGRLSFAQTWSTAGANTTRTTWNSGAAVTSTAGTGTYTGLPVIGFAAATFVNNSSLASYGTAYDHRYSRKISISQ